MSEPLDAEDYQATCAQMALLAKLLRPLHLAGVLASIGRAETLGPFLDPTLYRRLLYDPRAMLDLQLTKDLAHAFLMVQRIVEKAAVDWDALDSRVHGKGAAPMTPPTPSEADRAAARLILTRLPDLRRSHDEARDEAIQAIALALATARAEGAAAERAMLAVMLNRLAQEIAETAGERAVLETARNLVLLRQRGAP